MLAGALTNTRFAVSGVTISEAAPLMLLVTVSATARKLLPAVTSVELKVPVPPVRVAG